MKVTTIGRNELELLNQFILKAVDTEELHKLVLEELYEQAMNDPEDYTDIEGFHFDIALEKVWEREYEMEVPTIIYQTLNEMLRAKDLHEIEKEVIELLKEQHAFSNPLEAVGMSQRDFY